MAKSKEFILERLGTGRTEVNYSIDDRICVLKYLSGKPVQLLNVNTMEICHQVFRRFFGLKLKRGEKKRIRITIEPLE